MYRTKYSPIHGMNRENPTISQNPYYGLIGFLITDIHSVCLAVAGSWC